MFASGPISSGPRPWLLPHPIPHLIVTPPSPSPEDAGPTFLLERARRGGRRSQRPPSPELLHSTWTTRSPFSSYGHHPASPRRRVSLRPSRDPYAPYVPPPTSSTVTLLAAVLLPWFCAVSESLPPAGEGEAKRRRRRHRTTASPLALIILLFGGTLVLSAGLHAYTYSSEIDFELVDPGTGGGIFVRSNNLNPTTKARKGDVGLYLPPKASSQGWRKSGVRKQPAVAAASPREQGAAGFDVHVWDLL